MELSAYKELRETKARLFDLLRRTEKLNRTANVLYAQNKMLTKKLREEQARRIELERERVDKPYSKLKDQYAQAQSIMEIQRKLIQDFARVERIKKRIFAKKSAVEVVR